MTLPPATWQDILGKSVKPILNTDPKENLVDYNEKATFIKIIIINEDQCTCIHTPLSWQRCQQPHSRTYWENHSNQFWPPSQQAPCRLWWEDNLYKSSSKQAIALIILSALTSVLQTTEVAVAIFLKERSSWKKMVIKNDFL